MVLVDLLSSTLGVSGALVMLGLMAWHGREVLQAGQKAGTVVRVTFVLSTVLVLGLVLGIVQVDMSRLGELGTEAMDLVSELLVVMSA